MDSIPKESYRRIFARTLFLLLALFCKSASTLEDELLSKELEQCLSDSWGVDHHTNAFIINLFKPLMQDINHHSVIEKFIAISKRQNIDFSLTKKLKQLSPEDGTLKAPEEHLVVFDNPYVRILSGSTTPGKSENLHEHPWKSVMVIIIPTTYEIEYSNGKREIEVYPIGVYELPAGERYSCTNLGKSSDASLRFEIKD